MAQVQSPAAAQRERHEQIRGVYVIVILSILTILEFVVAITVDSSLWLVIGLTPFALLKAGFIFYFFMHVYKVWRGEEQHS
jgi:heme/copper-type cytochrome/quinol oxidase subunit 4